MISDCAPGTQQERSKQQQARRRKTLLPTPSQGPNAMKAAQAPVLAMMIEGERPNLVFTQRALEQQPPAADIWQD
jgi:hypothetical protein